MPEKKTDDGRVYDVDGKKFIWHPLHEDDEPKPADVVIPLRMKLKVIRGMAGKDMDLEAMFAILEALIPSQADALDELDVQLDFAPMFVAWQTEYQALSGATLGE